MWFVYRVQYSKDSSVVKSVYDFDDYEKTLQRYHATLASDMGNDSLWACLCMIIDHKGNTIEKFFYERKVEE